MPHSSEVVEDCLCIYRVRQCFLSEANNPARLSFHKLLNHPDMKVSGLQKTPHIFSMHAVCSTDLHI